MRIPNEMDRIALSNYEDEIRRISHTLGLTHVGSCISVLPILYEIYGNAPDRVLLDNAHSHLAHLMFTNYDKAEKLIKKHGIHCERAAGCDACGGSLGHALGIAIGMSLANPKLKIAVVMSDGSIQEGSCWEALRIRKLNNLDNITCYYNLNGYTAVSKVDISELENRIRIFDPSAKIYYTKNGKGLDGVAGHYLKV